MILALTDKKFFQDNKDSLPKRMFVFTLSILVWWACERYFRPFCGESIQQIRNYFGNGPFVQNVLSQSLPVDFVCFLMLIILCSAKIIPRPHFKRSLSIIAREGTLWGLLICVPTIALALYLGFKLGFAPNWQSILGNVISNSYEELTYRVFLFSVSAYAFKNVWAGVLTSALLFASIHSQYPFSMQIIVGLAAIFFSCAYLRAGSLFAALWAHELADMILDSILL